VNQPGLPPLPPGFQLEQAPPRRREGRDPWAVLQSEGFTATNGYRTQQDQERIRRQGYRPARNSDHLRGDGVDLEHPRLNPQQQVRRLRELFGDWLGAQIIYHDGHAHLGLPGWGGAPGTPGSPNSGLPAIPEGFQLEQRGSLAGGNFSNAPAEPPQPTQPPQQSALPAPERFAAYDGQGFSLQPSPLPPVMGTGLNAPDQEQVRGFNALMPPQEDPVRRQALERAVQDLFAGVPDDELLGRLREAGVTPTAENSNLIGYLGQRRELGLEGFRSRHARGLGVDPAAYTQTAQPLPTRLAAAAARGLTDLVGMPADAVNGVSRMVGMPVSDSPFMGSNWLRDAWTVPGNALLGTSVNLNDENLAPQGPVEDFAQRTAYFAGSSALPIAGMIGHGGRTIGALGMTRATAPVIGNGGPIAQSLTRLSVDAARRPGVAIASELGAAVGGAGGAEVARYGFPGNPAAEALGTVVGAVGGGFGAGLTAARALPNPYPRNALAAPTEAVQAQPSAYDAAPVQPEMRRAPVAPPRDPAIAPTRPRELPMAREDYGPEIVGPREPEAPGRAVEPALGRPPAAPDRPSPDELAGIARGVDPESVLPRPSNRVLSLEEHIRINRDRFRNVPYRDENLSLEMRTYPHPTRPGQTIRFRGPLDAESFLRRHGGLQEWKGELRHIGITDNKPRPEVPGEQRLGPILNPNGMTLDEAGEALWEAGYFPDLGDVRPTVSEVLDLLSASRSGRRTFLMEDMEEIERFYDAQALRRIVQSSESEGIPVVEDRSWPASADDLDATTPPVTAYEDLPEVFGRVGNINLNALESADDIGRLLQQVEDSFGGFDAARRGRMTFGEIQALADELGMTADDLMTRRHGQALNAEQALAARAILARSSDEVLDLARRTVGGSEAERAAFAEALLRHAAIQEQVTGAISEAGRALSSLRAAAQSRSVAGRIHQVTIESMGGGARLEEIADRILDLQRQGVGPGEVTRFAAKAIKPRFRDVLVELWYNSLLSGPQTHAVNTLSNLMTGALQFPEQALASVLGQVRRGFNAARGRPDDFDRITMSELGPRLVGYMQGTREGLRAFGRTLRTGEVADHVTKVESRVQEAVPGVAGKVIRVPSRLLAAEDEYFKAVARRMELSAVAARMARSEGLKGDAYRQRVAALTANPTDEMLERSLDYARYLTFQRPLGPVGQRVSQTTQEHVWLKLFLPFVRTPTNILKYAVERSPAAPILREVRRDLRAGGERRALAAARMMLGTGLGLTIMQMVEDGTITGGGPAWRGAEDLMRADGWQPYSIRVGDTYYSYQRLDPLALTMGVAADLHDYSRYMTPRQNEEAGALLIASILRNLENKTWLSGVSDLLGALNDPQRSLSSVTGRLAGSIAVPTLFSQTARYLDPVQRETRAPSFDVDVPDFLPERMIGKALGTIQNRIPGLSSQLEARRDVFGREVRSEGGLGPDLVSPIWTRSAQNDPVIAQLLSNMLAVGRPSRFRTEDGVRRELSPAEYGRYQEVSGRYIYDDLRALMASPEWQGMAPDERRRAVDRIKDDARRDARAELALDAPPMPPGFQMAR
jgi:hypothetical protein